MILVHTKSVNDEMPLLYHTKPCPVSTGSHPATPMFSLKYILFWLHHCPDTLVYLLYLILLQAADLKDLLAYYLLL